MNDVRVAAVQFEHTAGDKAANFRKIEAMSARAAEQRPSIVAFPECCITGYWFLRKLSRRQLIDLAEPIPDGASTQRLLSLARKHNMTIGAGLIERGEGDRLYNSYIVAMPDGAWRRHRKIHAFESEHIACGNEFTVFDTPHGCRVGVLICYDNNLIENVRITALMGAQVLLAPHQTGGCNSVSPHGMKPIDRATWDDRHADPDAVEAEFRSDKGRGWLMRWLPARAHDNGMFIVFSNGVGVDDDEIRTGNAMIIDPYGRILAETSRLADDVVVADLAAALLDKCTGQRWLTARRPELYGPLIVPTGRERDTRSVRFDR